TAPGTQYMQAPPPRKAEVKSTQVIGLLLAKQLCIPAIGAPVHHVSRLAQVPHQAVSQRTIVLGKQQPHQSSSSMSTSSNAPVAASYSSSMTRRSLVTISSS